MPPDHYPYHLQYPHKNRVWAKSPHFLILTTNKDVDLCIINMTMLSLLLEQLPQRCITSHETNQTPNRLWISVQVQVVNYPRPFLVGHLYCKQ